MHIIHCGAPSGYLTLSLGCFAFVPRAGDSIEGFIERADAALYQAKNFGRNRTVVLSVEADSPVKGRATVTE
ncbi:response regulator PleD [compost metagenome]